MLQLSTMKTFKQKVYEVVKKIPKSKVLTYQEVARRAGNSLASRAVGNILKTNYDPAIPCHRVIRSDGKLGNYNRGANKKRLLLKQEGYITS
jgi:methylated-DNA-[protein]-cysteine S-methyltransferase